MNAPGMILNGRYRLERQIGQGGSSSVFLAEDILIGKKWAVKFIPRTGKLSGRLAGNETELMGTLNHRAFPQIVDAFRTEEGYYIVSDLIKGYDLRSFLRKENPPLRQKCLYALKIISALKYLHDRRPPVLYLDLKPDNVMLCDDGELKLIDFGVAERLMEDRKRCGPGERNVSFGTRGYAAPEQYTGEAFDKRTDIFSFGMLFYSMLSLRDPDRDPFRQRRMIRDDGSIPRKIRKIILRCTAPDREDRYKEVSMIERELREYLQRPKRRIVLCLIALSLVLQLLALFVILGRYR